MLKNQQSNSWVGNVVRTLFTSPQNWNWRRVYTTSGSEAREEMVLWLISNLALLSITVKPVRPGWSRSLGHSKEQVSNGIGMRTPPIHVAIIA